MSDSGLMEKFHVVSPKDMGAVVIDESGPRGILAKWFHKPLAAGTLLGRILPFYPEARSNKKFSTKSL